MREGGNIQYSGWDVGIGSRFCQNAGTGSGSVQCSATSSSSSTNFGSTRTTSSTTTQQLILGQF